MTISSPATWALREATRPPVPWVPVEIAPAMVCSSMSPRLCSERPSFSSAVFSSCQRGAGQDGDGHRVAVHPDHATQAVGTQEQPVGDGDVGEGVTGPRHLDRELLVAGGQHGVDHVAGVVRVSSAGRVRGAQPGPARPCAHAPQVNPPPRARRARPLAGRAPRIRRRQPAPADAVHTQNAADPLTLVGHHSGQPGARGDPWR